MKNDVKKFKKISKNKLLKFRFKSNSLKFGTIGLKSTQSGILNLKQIESAKLTIIKITKNKSKIWLKSMNFFPVYSKSVGSRMGKGYGKFSHFIFRVHAGNILFEICGSNKKQLIKSLLACKFKLPVKTKICFK